MKNFYVCLEDTESDTVDGWYDVEVIVTQIGDRLTENEDLHGMNVVPIAALFSGDFICMDFRVTQEPVVIWFHEESKEFAPVTQKVAEGLSEFFEMLKG